jgi:hypothetical protein
MKKVLILTFALLVYVGTGFAQTETEVPAPEKANKGQEISSLAKSLEGGPEKGKAISSAARRSGVMSDKSGKASEKMDKAAEKANERAALGAENAEAGKARAHQMRPEGAGKGSRPHVQVPPAQPNTPVGRPVTPGGNGRRPMTPPGKPSGN